MWKRIKGSVSIEIIRQKKKVVSWSPVKQFVKAAHKLHTTLGCHVLSPGGQGLVLWKSLYLFIFFLPSIFKVFHFISGQYIKQNISLVADRVWWAEETGHIFNNGNSSPIQQMSKCLCQLLLLKVFGRLFCVKCFLLTSLLQSLESILICSSFAACSCWGYASIPAANGWTAGFNPDESPVLRMTFTDRQPFALIFTPMDNLESMNLTCFWRWKDPQKTHADTRACKLNTERSSGQELNQGYSGLFFILCSLFYFE